MHLSAYKFLKINQTKPSKNTKCQKCLSATFSVDIWNHYLYMLYRSTGITTCFFKNNEQLLGKSKINSTLKILDFWHFTPIVFHAQVEYLNGQAGCISFI